MKRLMGAAAAVLAVQCLSAAAWAQTGYTTVTTSCLGGCSTKIASATIYWQPLASAGGSPASALVGGSGSGQITAPAYSTTVTNGASSILLPDALATDPNICYAVTVIDATGVTDLGAGMNGIYVRTGGPYGCVQPTGSTWSFDSYVPTVTPVVLPASAFASPTATALSSGASPTASVTMLTDGQYQLAFGIPAGPAGPTGASGNTIWNGSGAPSSGTGSNGDFYLNTATSCLYGPKASGAWPGTCTSLIGPTGSAANVNNAAQYNVPYYSNSGSSDVLSGSSAFTFSPGSPNTLTLQGLMNVYGLYPQSQDGNGNLLMNGETTANPSGTLTTLSDAVAIGAGGTGTNLGNYAAYELTTTATFTSGATSMTVASAGTCSTSNPIGCVRPYMNISCAAGLASGTTVSSTYNNLTSGTTVPLSAAATANETNVSCTFTPGNTTGGVFIGYNTGAKVVDQAGTVAIGVNTFSQVIGAGLGGEDMNDVAIGPNVAQGETGMWYQNPFNTGQTQTGAEFVAIGNKAYEHGYGEDGSIMLGTHNYCPALGTQNLWISPTSCGTGWSGTTPYSFIAGNTSIFLGANMFGMAPVTAGTVYQTSNDIYVGAGGFGIWYNTGPDTIIGANFGNNSGTPTTLSSAANNVFIESGAPASGGYGPFAANWTGGSADVVVTAQAGNYFGGGLGSDPLGVTIFGAGAGAAINNGNYSTLIGYEAGAKTGDSNLTAVGSLALFDYTDTSHSTQYVTAVGQKACYSELTSANLYCSGALSGLNETAADVSYAGPLAGDRSAASAGLNSAFGYEEFYDTSGATGAETEDAFFGGESDCQGCTSSNSLGWGANIGAVANATQIGAGTNSTANSIQFGSLPLAITTALTAAKVTGCGTVTSPTGNGMAGTFAAGQTSCAPVVTTGVTAPHGFVCGAHDLTNPADAFTQASSTTTTATFNTATVTSGDTVAFDCRPY